MIKVEAGESNVLRNGARHAASEAPGLRPTRLGAIRFLLRMLTGILVLATAIPVAAAPTSTPTPSRIPTRTPTRAAAASRTPTRTPTRTPSRTPTRTASRTPTRTASRTPTRTPSRTPTRTPSRTPTRTPSRTPTRTASRTPTRTRTATQTPTRTPTATPTAALALWVDNSLPGTITEFKGATLTSPGASIPSPAVTNQSADLFPDTAGVTFDSSNNQWATVCGNNSGNHGSITEFTAATVAKLATNSTPAADVVLSDDGTGKLVSCPWETVFDKSGNLWAANSNEFQVIAAPGFVTEYQRNQFVTGHPTPHITLTDPTEFVSPTGVVFDSTGNLFVADFGPGNFIPPQPGSGTVFVFKAATVGSLTAGTNNVKADARLFDDTTATPVAGAFDSNGNLWVADCEAANSGELYMFPKAVLTSGASKATTIFQSTSITTASGPGVSIDCPGGVAFDAQGNLWYTNFSGDFVDGYGAVGEFTKAQLLVSGKSTPTPNIFLGVNNTRTNIVQPIGLTFGPVF